MTPRPAPAPLTLLYVDDEPDIRTIATLALELDRGLTVHAAGSIDAALALLDGACPAPDAALLDVMMPDGGGTELLARIRARPGLETLPVIFMTARARAQDIARYQALGVAGMVVKPFDPLTLAPRIRAMLDPAQADGGICADV